MADSLDTDVNSWLKQGGSAPVSTAPPPSEDATAKDVDTWLKGPVQPKLKLKPITSPTVGDVATQAGKILGEAGKKTWDAMATKPDAQTGLESDLMAIPEATRALAQGAAGMVAGPAVYWGAQGLKSLGAKVNPQEVENWVNKKLEYTPPGRGGQILTQAASLPFTAAQGLGDTLKEENLAVNPNHPALAFAAGELPQALVMLSPFRKSTPKAIETPKGGSDDGGGGGGGGGGDDGGGGGGGGETDEINVPDAGKTSPEASKFSNLLSEQKGPIVEKVEFRDAPTPQPSVEPSGRRAASGVNQEARKVYDALTPNEREEIPIRDALTKVYSQGMYHAMKGPERPQTFIDLRNFKELQEPAGKPASHGFGDEVLKAVGEEAQKSGIPLFRYGGDEFSILGDKNVSLEQARTLKKSLQNRVVRYTAKDGTVYERHGVDIDYGFGKNRDAADAASKVSKTANKAAAGPKTGRESGTVVETTAKGRESGSAAPDLERALNGTNAEHTPVTRNSAGKISPDFQINHVRFGNEDIALPVRDVYENPDEEVLDKIGHQEFQAEQAGKRNAYTDRNPWWVKFKAAIRRGAYPWVQKDMKANLAYALDSYLKKKDIRQVGYSRMENASGADAILKDPDAHGITFHWKDDYTPDKTVVKCGL